MKIPREAMESMARVWQAILNEREEEKQSAVRWIVRLKHPLPEDTEINEPFAFETREACLDHIEEGHHD